jgi:peroxiredoxin
MLNVGDFAGEFQILDITGQERTLEELLATDPVVLAFFKVSCPTCQLTLPFLERFYSQRQLVYSVSQDDVRSTQAFADRFRLTMPMLIDDPKRGYPVSNAFGITNVPSMFQIEKDHRISWASAGFVKKDLEALGHMHHIGMFHVDDDVPAARHG